MTRRFTLFVFLLVFLSLSSAAAEDANSGEFHSLAGPPYKAMALTAFACAVLGTVLYILEKRRSAAGRAREVQGFTDKLEQSQEALKHLEAEYNKLLSRHRELEQQAWQGQKREVAGQLAGGIAHDLKNQLTVITGYSEMLRDATSEVDGSRELADEVLKAAQQATNLTRQLMAFSRRTPEPEVLNLNTVSERQPPEIQVSGGKETLLIVEDQKQLRVLAARVLEANGYEVLAAQTGEEALRLFEKHHGPIHLTVTDVVMPGMSGRELMKKLRLLCADMRVLYMSGYADEAVFSHEMMSAGDNFLPKPFTPMTLVRKVREILGQKPALRRFA